MAAKPIAMEQLKQVLKLYQDGQSIKGIVHCTKLNKRIIHRSVYRHAVDRNNKNIRENPAYYKRR